jgi:hypothetical protein
VSRSALAVKTAAVLIERKALAAAPEIAAFQVAQIMRSLTGLGHKIGFATLSALGSTLLLRDCLALKLATDQQWKDITWAFTRQVCDL